jgi:hypothetical protein
VSRERDLVISIARRIRSSINKKIKQGTMSGELGMMNLKQGTISGELL